MDFPITSRRGIRPATVSLPFFRTLACIAAALSLTMGYAAPLSAPATGETHVTALPDDTHELSGVTPGGGYHAAFDAQGNLTSLTDASGGVQLVTTSSVGVTTQGVSVTNAAGAALALAGDKPQYEAAGGGESRAVVDYAPGVHLTYIAQPGRLGIQADGPDPAYQIVLRSPIRIDGAYVMSGAAAHFLSSDSGAIAGQSQVLTDMRRSRALSIDAPAGSVRWSLRPFDGWGGEEIVEIITTLKSGQTLWLTPVPVPEAPGAISFGLSGQYAFRSDGAVRLVASISSRSIAAPVKLHLSALPDTIAAGDTVYAALVPTSPYDPVEAITVGWQWMRNNNYTHQLIPVKLEGSGQDWTVTAKPDLAPGVYRLRVWIAPADTTRAPAALGGPPHAIAPLFPDFSLTDPNVRQTSPQGDTFVTMAPPAAGSLAVVSPPQRFSFWRGESAPVLVQARSAGDVTALVHVTVTPAAGGAPIGANGLRIETPHGFGTGEMRISTANLAPGEYVVRAEAAGFGAAEYRFRVSGAPESGMADIQSPLSGGPYDVDGFARIGANVWTDVMPGGFAPGWASPSNAGNALVASTAALPFGGQIVPSGYDDLVRDNWMQLQGIQSRQISFGLHHSIPEQVEETHRKDQAFAEFGRRYPSTLGIILDYDLTSTSAYDYGSPSYHQGILDRAKLLESRWEAAWARDQKQGATDADKGRLHALFNAGIVAEMYRPAVAEIHDATPQQRVSSSITADHNTIDAGQYFPVEYGPLDFRYIEVWNDQIYPDSAGDMQESFWTDLLDMEKPAGQPVWLTIPTAAQPGTHLRRSLEAIARGATGIGYGGEGSAGLVGGWGATISNLNARYAQEAESGDMARKYGSWLNQFAPAPQVAILYSVSQGGYNFAISDPRFFAYYVCAQIDRPAKLITEDEIARGELKSVKVALIIGQTAKLPAATVRALEAFTAGGGHVFCDGDTTVSIAGSVKLAKLQFPGSLWPYGGNLFHGLLKQMVTNQGAILKAAFGEYATPSLDSPDGAALVAEKRSGDSTLVIVTNNFDYPLGAVFNDDERLSAFYRKSLDFTFIAFKDVRMPCTAALTIRADLAAKPLHIYDVFGGRELPIDRTVDPPVVHVDLATLLGRALLLTSGPLPAPRLLAAPRADSDTAVTVAAVSPVPQPVAIRVGGQTVYRAATPDGLPVRFAIGPRPGAEPVEMTSLITGETRHAQVRLSKPAVAAITVAPPVQVFDQERVRKVLRTQGVTIEVDARQSERLPLAQALSRKIGAGVLFNPPVTDYPVTYAPTAAQAQVQSDVKTQHLIGWRLATEGYFQWTGAMVPTAVWTSPGILFGTGQDNRLIGDLDGVTLLTRPPTAEMIGPGKAVIEAVESPFWNGQNVIVCLCSDQAGMAAACEALETLAAGGNIPGAVALDDDGGARAERRAAFGFDPPARTDGMAPLDMQPAAPHPVAFGPFLPVIGLAATSAGVLAAVQSPGRNAALIGDDGTVKWQTASAGYFQPQVLDAAADGSFVTWDSAITWRHDSAGKLLWKSPGEPVRAPGSDGSTWLVTDSELHRIGADGTVTKTLPLALPYLGLSPDGTIELEQKSGTGGTIKFDSAVVAVDTSTGHDLWTVPNMQVMITSLSESPTSAQIEAVFSADSSRVALIQRDNRADRDDIEPNYPNEIAVLDAHTGKIIQRVQMGESIAFLQITADGKRGIAFGQGYSNAMFVLDIDTGVTRRIELPENGSYARVLSQDQKAMWIAGDHLYKVDLDTLDVTKIADEQFMSLAPRPSGGVCGGTLAGDVVTIDDTGKIAARVSLASGVAPLDADENMAGLRNAPMVDGGNMEPNVVPATIKLLGEYATYFNYNGSASARADNIVPLQTAIKVTSAGRYRFMLLMGNAKTSKIGLVRLTFSGIDTPLDLQAMSDKWHQAGDIDLKPGTYLVTFTSQDMSQWNDSMDFDTLTVALD